MRTVIRWTVIVTITVHGLIHLLGAVKGLGLAAVPDLQQPTTAAGGLFWLLAALLVLAAPVALTLRHRSWWAVTGAAALVSQLVILSAWDDARAGTVLNAVMILAAAYGYASSGPRSLRTQYQRGVTRALSAPRSDLVAAAVSPEVTEGDHDYRHYGHRRIAARGDAVWHSPEGAFSYLEIHLDDITYDHDAHPATAGVPQLSGRRTS